MSEQLSDEEKYPQIIPEDLPDEEKPERKAPKKKGPVKHILLSEDMLCGKNGIIKLENVFKDFKFEGKGRENEDLNRILEKLENWAHLLNPRSTFSQTLERIEYLGLKKRSVKTYVKKVRMGLITTGMDELSKEFVQLDEDDEFLESSQFNSSTTEDIPTTQENNNEFPSDDDDFLFAQDEMMDTI